MIPNKRMFLAHLAEQDKKRAIWLKAGMRASIKGHAIVAALNESYDEAFARHEQRRAAANGAPALELPRGFDAWRKKRKLKKSLANLEAALESASADLAQETKWLARDWDRRRLPPEYFVKHQAIHDADVVLCAQYQTEVDQLQSLIFECRHAIAGLEKAAHTS